jgi:hypothetical protein
MSAKHRITINLEADEYKTLVDMAERADRSIAWIGRRAILDFIGMKRRVETPAIGVGHVPSMSAKSTR